MREFILNNESNDPSEVLVIKNESLNIHEKTPTMYESRKKFKKNKRMFLMKKEEKNVFQLEMEIRGSLSDNQLRPYKSIDDDILSHLHEKPILTDFSSKNIRVSISRTKNDSSKCTKKTMHNDPDAHANNNLFFIDDLKLQSIESSTLSTMKDALFKILLSSRRCCVYEFLGILEDINFVPLETTQKKSFDVTNQHVISLSYYHRGIFLLELINNKLHYRTGYKEWVYLSRTELKKTHTVLSKAQLAKLYNRIEKRKPPPIIIDSSRGPKKEKIWSRDEETRCKMLGQDYTRRHNKLDTLQRLISRFEIIESILLFCNKRKNKCTLKQVGITSQETQ
ncbi:hypothetical protein CWI38_0835p0020 [Hamiltosporidium tvaerminnensis]|uniref:Uncharacterized protein n=1 Tax=Hamiltosporidium tvaerminnensis TaxID=1176355 RepID=A0A4Q9LX34_9MICR|nr:hypothetical protein CWI38_0835p0020 [Hamiltosporidium tvaerminnensis]